MAQKPDDQEKEKDKDKEKDNDHPIKLIVYDFDQTISSEHIYHKLDGMANLRNMQGQMIELEAMSLDDLIDLFGGKERIERLDTHYKRVTEVADVAILSYGYVSVIAKSLERVKLWNYFEKATIIGCDSAELNEVHGNKAQCILQMRQSKQRKLKSHQVLFVDDDATNTNKAKSSNICETMDINPRNGMTAEHMESIEKMVGVLPLPNNDPNKPNSSNANAKQNVNNNDNSDNIDSNDSNNNNSNDNSDTNNNDNNNNIDTSNNNNDDNKESTTLSRKPSWKDKFKIDAKAVQLLNSHLQNEDENEGTPVVDVVDADSDSESNAEIGILSTPQIPSLISANGDGHSTND